MLRRTAERQHSAVLVRPACVPVALKVDTEVGYRIGSNACDLTDQLLSNPGEVLDNVYNQEVIEQWKARLGGKAII